MEPVLIRDSSHKITYYAFTREQAVYITKLYERSKVDGQLIDSLESHVKTYQRMSAEYDSLTVQLEKTNKTLYKITVNYDQLTQKYDALTIDMITIKVGLEQKIKRKNKAIFLLVTSNVLTLGIIAAIVFL